MLEFFFSVLSTFFSCHCFVFRHANSHILFGSCASKIPRNGDKTKSKMSNVKNKIVRNCNVLVQLTAFFTIQTDHRASNLDEFNFHSELVLVHSIRIKPVAVDAYVYKHKRGTSKITRLIYNCRRFKLPIVIANYFNLNKLNFWHS